MSAEKGLGFFEKYLTLWVGACIIVGVLIGQFFPAFPEILSRFEYSHVSIPVGYSLPGSLRSWASSTWPGLPWLPWSGCWWRFL